jgi:hypothetical protein
VRVVLGVEHSEGNSSSSNEESSSGKDDSESPAWQQRKDGKGSLLISVGEVVVSGGHVVEDSGLVHLEDSSIEVLRSSVQQSAVSNILFVGVLWVSSAVGLVEEGKSKSSSSIFEQWLESSVELSIGNWVVVGFRVDLNEVRSIGLIGSFSCISSWVGITSGPLEVDIVSNSDGQELGNIIVFGGWVSLDDISSLSSNVQVEQSGSSRDSIGSLGNVEDVRSVFEGSSVLSGIGGQEEGRVRRSSNPHVLGDNCIISVVGPVEESSSWVGHIWISFFSGGNVVSDS